MLTFFLSTSFFSYNYYRMELEKICAKHLLHDLPGISCILKQAYCPQESLGFTMQQMRVLSFLKLKPLSTTELAHKMNVSLPAISRMTHMMISSNWVEKVTAECDRRQILMSLTPSGKALLKSAQEKSLEKLLPQLKKITDKDKKILIRSFEIINDLLSTQITGEKK